MEKFWRDERNAGRRPVGWKPMAYFLCGSLKHLEYDCKKKKEIMENLKGVSDDEKGKKIETDPLICFSSGVSGSKGNETDYTWVSDSGSSHHVCNTLKFLLKFTKEYIS